MKLRHLAFSQGARLCRQAWVGLSGNWGQVSLGRQYTMLFWAMLADLGDGMKANFVLESGFAPDSGVTNRSRLGCPPWRRPNP
ncbi:protein of unknown function (plasmid) [Cupriavidus taiwanensis]|uniref:Porin domain-containing protein n=1 Tax=Cupriavidus taiwanensis TaxID=164546 RepID=A0A375I8L6_9BURK|nr:hypothetical protein CT19425_U520011 [Cupriavidus taiwanensis]SPK77558.1 protein of unknown function [Cupriavidus taiwanensis]